MTKRNKTLVAQGKYPTASFASALDHCDDAMRPQVEELSRQLVDTYHRNRIGTPLRSCIEVKVSREIPTALLDLAIRHLLDQNIGWRIERAAIQEPNSDEESYFFNRSLPEAY
jgi:hypothetical protein